MSIGCSHCHMGEYRFDSNTNHYLCTQCQSVFAPNIDLLDISNTLETRSILHRLLWTYPLHNGNNDPPRPRDKDILYANKIEVNLACNYPLDKIVRTINSSIGHLCQWQHTYSSGSYSAPLHPRLMIARAIETMMVNKMPSGGIVASPYYFHHYLCIDNKPDVFGRLLIEPAKDSYIEGAVQYKPSDNTLNLDIFVHSHLTQISAVVLPYRTPKESNGIFWDHKIENYTYIANIAYFNGYDYCSDSRDHKEWGGLGLPAVCISVVE